MYINTYKGQRYERTLKIREAKNKKNGFKILTKLNKKRFRNSLWRRIGITTIIYLMGVVLGVQTWMVLWVFR